MSVRNDADPPTEDAAAQSTVLRNPYTCPYVYRRSAGQMCVRLGHHQFRGEVSDGTQRVDHAWLAALPPVFVLFL
ncbi:MAG TPA: hypothetical protein VGJ60_21190 [Chloroflexota bacterium]